MTDPEPAPDPPDPPDPYIGRAVGNYVIEKKLGRGGMGAVYRLRHVELPDTFEALKVLTDGGPAARDRFRQEALVAARIGSHRVVKPLDLGQFENGVPYIVMEYVPGRSLEEELALRGALEVALALRIAARVADTMVIAHAAGIVHRDLKPGNLMLLPEGDDDFQVKLLDFGIARATGDIKLARTHERVVMGTPGYWSPEQVSGNISDGRTDVFALGIILYQMLTGELPFVANTVEAAMMSVLTTAEAPAPSSRRPARFGPVPKEVDAAVAGALRKERDQRFVMLDFHAVLLAALSRSGGGKMASIVVPVRPPRQEAPTLSPSSEQPLLIDAARLPGGAPADGDTAKDPALPAVVEHFADEPQNRKAVYWTVSAILAVAIGIAVVGFVRRFDSAAKSEVPAPEIAAPRDAALREVKITSDMAEPAVPSPPATLAPPGKSPVGSAVKSSPRPGKSIGPKPDVKEEF